MRAMFAFCALVVTGCSPQSGVGLVLPPGDVVKGEAAFRELGCPACHEVLFGRDLPAPTAKPPVRKLGGFVAREPTDGQLLTHVINPSHHIAEALGSQVNKTGPSTSRMPDYTQKMTVRQLIDITAYLHSVYKSVAPGQEP